jgi:hypothetical protein
MNQEIITIGRDGYFNDATIKYRHSEGIGVIDVYSIE